jgi:hypothetical protein
VKESAQTSMHYGLRRHAAPLRDAAPATSASCRLLWAGPHSAHHLRKLAPTVGNGRFVPPVQAVEAAIQAQDRVLVLRPLRVERAVACRRVQVLVQQGEVAKRLEWLFRWRIGSTSSLSSSLARCGSEATPAGITMPRSGQLPVDDQEPLHLPRRAGSRTFDDESTKVVGQSLRSVAGQPSAKGCMAGINIADRCVDDDAPNLVVDGAPVRQVHAAARGGVSQYGHRRSHPNHQALAQQRQHPLLGLLLDLAGAGHRDLPVKARGAASRVA